MQRKNPLAFYFSVDVRRKPCLTWQHNVSAHFGKSKISRQDFSWLVHPYWRELYFGMEKVVFSLARPGASEANAQKFVLTVNVPLRNADGKYYWYSQVSYPASFDEEGRIVEYLNEFHRLTEFDRMIPNRTTHHQ